MRKYFRITCKTFLWLLYLCVTGKQRQMYAHAKMSRRQVLKVKNDAFGSTYELGRHLKENEKPKRDYLNWKEFRKLHKF